MRISDWSSNVCSSDLVEGETLEGRVEIGDRGIRAGVLLFHRLAGRGIAVHCEEGCGKIALQLQLVDEAAQRGHPFRKGVDSLCALGFLELAVGEQAGEEQHAEQDRKSVE